MDPKAELRRIVAKNSLLYREEGFLLASGKRSPYYFDMKLTTLVDPNALRLASQVLFERIAAIPGRVDAIGGPTSGADPLIIGVSQYALTQGRVLPAFFVRDEQKTHGTERVIEGVVSDGMSVVIVDDVMTTGNSVLKAVRPVEKAGATVRKILVLVDREEGGTQTLVDYSASSQRKHDFEAVFTFTELKSSLNPNVVK